MSVLIAACVSVLAMAPSEEPPSYEIVVVSERSPTPHLPDHRAKTEVTRQQMERRIPRSSPDALRFEPGVFVQQTAHGQGSVFIRGLTGQQTLLLFDGIRLNNSTYRQGPNQYFFTLDSQTIESIQVLRGGASTLYGSDALGGVILALPIEPHFQAEQNSEEFVQTKPRVRFKSATQDQERGGRADMHLSFGNDIAFFGGVGGRRVGLLESGGKIYNPKDGKEPLVPRFKKDGRTQLGTGFDEITGDARFVYRASNTHTLKVAAYMYRQYDAPRTDQCPAAYAPFDECLTYDEQFRTLVYGVWEGKPGLNMLNSLRATWSWQQQHERLTLKRPSARVKNIGRDVVNTFGMSFVGNPRFREITPWLKLSLHYGVDTYLDMVSSAAWIRFTDIHVTEKRSRGKYLDRSQYLYGGAFAEGTFRLFRKFILRSGFRFSWIAANAKGDPESGSQPIDENWYPWVGNAGLEWQAFPKISFLFNVDHSFRAPNLDDMTSRQQTGPGFQFENAALRPETATTLEVGTRYQGPIQAELWVFRSYLHNLLIKSPKQDADCPPGTPRCDASWTRFQLVNAHLESRVEGIEATLFASFHQVDVRAILGWIFGQTPNVADPALFPGKTMPMTRIPPPNGVLEILCRVGAGFSFSGALRLATLQDRLALSDRADARIPEGGTPGFAVLDANANYRIPDMVLISVAFENIFDAAYRYHGSSINGPGRGMSLLLDFGPLWR